MNGVPVPYANGTHLVVAGKVVVVAGHAPNADGWRYVGFPEHLAGAELHFSHHEASPVPTRGIAPTARGLLARADLDPEQFDNELSIIEAEEPKTPLEELLAAAIAVIHSGSHRIPDLRGAVIRYQDQEA